MIVIAKRFAVLVLSICLLTSSAFAASVDEKEQKYNFEMITVLYNYRAEKYGAPLIDESTVSISVDEEGTNFACNTKDGSAALAFTCESGYDVDSCVVCTKNAESLFTASATVISYLASGYSYSQWKEALGTIFDFYLNAVNAEKTSSADYYYIQDYAFVMQKENDLFYFMILKR